MNYLHFLVLYRKNFLCFSLTLPRSSSSQTLWPEDTLRPEDALRRISASSSQAPLRTWFHPLFLYNHAHLHGPFLLFIRFFESTPPLTTMNSVNLNPNPLPLTLSLSLSLSPSLLFSHLRDTKNSVWKDVIKKTKKLQVRLVRKHELTFLFKGEETKRQFKYSFFFPLVYNCFRMLC